MCVIVKIAKSIATFKVYIQQTCVLCTDPLHTNYLSDSWIYEIRRRLHDEFHLRVKTNVLNLKVWTDNQTWRGNAYNSTDAPVFGCTWWIPKPFERMFPVLLWHGSCLVCVVYWVASCNGNEVGVQDFNRLTIKQQQQQQQQQQQTRTCTHLT